MKRAHAEVCRVDEHHVVALVGQYALRLLERLLLVLGVGIDYLHGEVHVLASSGRQEDWR